MSDNIIFFLLEWKVKAYVCLQHVNFISSHSIRLHYPSIIVLLFYIYTYMFLLYFYIKIICVEETNFKFVFHSGQRRLEGFFKVIFLFMLHFDLS